MPRFPPDDRDIIRREQSKTTGYVWARHEPGLTAVDYETEHVPNRAFVAIPPDDLGAFPKHDSWAIGFFITTTDELATACSWISKRGPQDRRRCMVIYGPQLTDDEVQAALADVGGGCPLEPCPGLESCTAASNAHQLFGYHHGRQVLEDYHGRAS